MNKPLTLIITTIALLTAFSSVAAAQACIESSDDSGTECFTLYAGQHIDAGTVCVTLNDENLEVSYNTIDGWELVETHLWVGDSLSSMPQTRQGNPIPGRFPYNSGDITGATSYTSIIPVTSLDFTCPSDPKSFLMAAHASVQKLNPDGTVAQSETGWSDGNSIADRGSWATYSSFTLTCDCGEEPEEVQTQCETAFAAGGTCFLDIDEDGDNVGDFNRWGWTLGTMSEGSYSFPIYAGAGQCDLEKGTLVGELQVDYSNGVATLTYHMNDGFEMTEAHSYAGAELLPQNIDGFYTVAPGQYPVVEEFESTTSVTHELGNLSGDIYVVAHAVVCGAF